MRAESNRYYLNVPNLSEVPVCKVMEQTEGKKLFEAIQNQSVPFFDKMEQHELQL
jgi:hypothetical protein